MEIIQGLTGTAFETGYSILESRGSAIVGMSLGNSYFNRPTIDELLYFCATSFCSLSVMIPDLPAEHTYKALGYSAEQAQRKARLGGNTLRNHCQGEVQLYDNISIFDWQRDVESHGEYCHQLETLRLLYNSNPNFKENVQSATAGVVQRKLKKERKIEDAIEEGIHYLLKELAFLSVAPSVLGVERIGYVYHQQWKIYEDFVDGKFNGIKRNDLGFIIVNSV